MNYLSSEKMIKEINAIRDSFIKTRPKMDMNAFVSSQKMPYNMGSNAKKIFIGAGSSAFQKHPLGYGNINGNTLHPDPLYSGIIYEPSKGGAVLSKKIPLTGSGYCSSSDSECDSESDSESESDYEGGDLLSEEYSSDEEEQGAGIYDKYIKPAGKHLGNTLYDVGKFAFHDVVVPLGKELLKKAIIGAMTGAGIKKVYGGKITGSKIEFIHILKKINPKLSLRDLDKKTEHELSRQLYKILELGMHPEDLKSLHYIDALAQANKSKGGLNGTKAELKKILVAMYPKLNLEKLSKEDIVNKIVRHVDDAEEKRRIKEDFKHIKLEKLKAPKKVKIINKLDDDEWFNKNFAPTPEENFDEEVEFQHPEVEFQHPEVEEVKEIKKRGRPPKLDKVLKEKKPVGRPKKEKVLKEKKPVGRPKKEKLEKEKKPRGRPKKNVQPVEHEHKVLADLDNIFDEILKPKKNIKIKVKKTEGGKIKKLIGTKRGNKARGAIVAEVMKKQGLTLPQASKYVSQHNLY
jgi:hypothetical protein